LHISPRMSPWDPDSLTEPFRTIVLALEQQYPCKPKSRSGPSDFLMEHTKHPSLADVVASPLSLDRSPRDRPAALPWHEIVLPHPTLGPDRSTAYEQLAALVAFADAEDREPDFYSENADPLDFAAGFIAHLAASHSVLEDAFLVARRSSTLVSAAQAIEWAIHSGVVSKKDLQWIDRQMTAVLRYLLTLVLRAKVPASLREAELAVRGAFEAPLTAGEG
jgi:hypothetical protein